MPNTYTQIHIQCVFAVKNRLGLIRNEWKIDLFKYITGIVHSFGHKILAVNGVSDHIHVFFGMRPTQSLSELMQAVKANSSKWINERGFTKGRFEWQDGYGGFSYSKSHVDRVVRYINNQEEHHRIKTFMDEYKELLDEFNIPYDDKYLFREPV